jgi:NADPH:quinone reductase-like Zn-dependent oxidoreductase
MPELEGKTESTSHIAVVAAAYGGPEVLSVVDAEVLPPGPGEVTIEVRAAGSTRSTTSSTAGPSADPRTTFRCAWDSRSPE